MRASVHRLSILVKAVALTGPSAALLIAAGLLSACGTSGSRYPNLADMPSLPANMDGETQREKIIKELEEERESPDGATSSPRSPAVPAKPLSLLVPSVEVAEAICEDPAPQTAQVPASALPPLRGTLHGDWRPPAVAPLPGGEGVTASIPKGPPGAVILTFGMGSTQLAEADMARLRAAAADFILRNGEKVLVEARGGAPATSSGADARRPLASLSLGLRRASAIADALIADGIRADLIKISAQGEEEVPGLAMKDWNNAGPDGAIVVFQGGES